MDVAHWLRQLGLERYEAAFRENDVSAAILSDLTAEDLKELELLLRRWRQAKEGEGGFPASQASGSRA
jgi:hypothetical protein